jgi:hypothetical protein
MQPGELRRSENMAFRSWRIAAVITALALVGAPSIARSQCAKDTDCKGARICAAGQCVGAAPTSTVRDWSLAGGIVGAVGAGLTIGFSIPIEFGMDDPPPAPIVLAGTSVLLTIVISPITASGGRSARRAAGVEGEPGARVGGWIFYGLDLMFIPTMALFSAFYLDGPPPHGWMALFGLGGALSQSLLAADAFVARSQAKALRPNTADRARGSGVASAPRIAPFAAPSQDGGAVVGVAGSF